MSLEIIETDDAGLLAELNREVHELHYGISSRIFKPYDRAAMESAIAGFLREENVRGFAAYYEGEAAGYLVIRLIDYSDNPFKYPYRALYIDQLCVKSAFRGKGLGRELMEFALNIAKAEGIKRIELDVWNANSGGKEFYRTLGFSTYQEKMALELG